MFNKENLLKFLCCGIVGIVFLSIFLFYNIDLKGNGSSELVSLNEFIHDENEFNNDENEFNKDEREEKSTIIVEIKGEVLKPDVYELEEGSIVKELIMISGGLTEVGDVSNINQARKLNNGECIVVSSRDEIVNLKNNLINDEGLISNEINNSSFENDGLININTSSREELKTLNGIGDTLAESIIKYREENGNFKSIEDLKNVSRIGNKTFEKFKDKIKV